jgi:hypothetical protein
VLGVGIGVVLVGGREDVAQVADGGIDLVDRYKTFDQHPSVVAPCRDVAVERYF